jgi:hypothetical protein
MIRQARPLAEITAEALKILYREIGVVDTLRFVNQYTTGCGDYTGERDGLFAGMTLNNIVSEIKQKRKARSSPSRKGAERKRESPGMRSRTRRGARQKTK